ncbi:SDR family oxidoreductase [Alloalcanivorax sp. C16-2]|uniref:SDR family oxidoreductase n=1 Tax=Alloalcanivorax TaxID=3020832 RepID=UPI0019321305|nr:SDR family oxidoreductase [Alloalcanivorax marinus]MBL7249916.1 SDR family oxidoreductase [Alloalcanivorax marinus]
MNELNFENTSVFVAGGSSGINLAIAEAFAARGARLFLISRSEERVDAAVAGLRERGGEARGCAADVRDPAALEAAYLQATEWFGEIDVLISGAAGNFLAGALEMSCNAFKTVIDIDLLGTFNVLRCGHAFLRKPGASVLNISAPQAFNPTRYQVHACAAKAGVDMVTRVLAMEWGGHGIRINSLVPGPIGDTEGIRRLAPNEAALARMRETVPLRRLGSLAEVANMAMTLCSPLAGFVTGAVLTVDGGSSLQGGRDLKPE